MGCYNCALVSNLDFCWFGGTFGIFWFKVKDFGESEAETETSGSDLAFGGGGVARRRSNLSKIKDNSGKTNSQTLRIISERFWRSFKKIIIPK